MLIVPLRMDSESVWCSLCVSVCMLTVSNALLMSSATVVPTTPACTWWNRQEEDLSSGKLESTHPSRTSVKPDQGFWCSLSCMSVMHVNADSLFIRAATTWTSGGLNDLTTDLIMANNNNSATVIVRTGGLFWLKPVAMVLFMLCSAVIVEWLLLKPCCMEMCGMLFVMYGSSVFSSLFGITERSEMGLAMCLC